MADDKLTPEEKAEKARLYTQHQHALKIESIKRMERSSYGTNTTLEYKSSRGDINKIK
tara:strand:- start:392 stop:565 length:174 start_codon:yes stop_codon:yes gene_type:complete